MKLKNSILIFSIAGVFLLPAFCFGAHTYSRDPSGSYVSVPLTISVSGGNLYDEYGILTRLSWALVLEGGSNPDVIGLCRESEALRQMVDIIEVFPSATEQTYSGVKLVGYGNEICFGEGNDIYYLEGDGNSVIFTIGPPLPPAPVSIINIDAGGPGKILEISGQLFTDTKLLIFMAIGLPVGFWIIYQLIGLFRTSWKKDDELIAKVEKTIKGLK